MVVSEDWSAVEPANQNITDNVRMTRAVFAIDKSRDRVRRFLKCHKQPLQRSTRRLCAVEQHAVAAAYDISENVVLDPYFCLYVSDQAKFEQ